MVNIIISCTKNGGVAFNDKIPWNIPSQLKLSEIIINNSNIIMGYNTWEKNKFKPIINCNNIVLTRSKEKTEQIKKNYKNVLVYNNINDVIVKYNNNYSFFIGGVSIFNYLIENNLITNLYINIIHDKYNTNQYIDLDKLKSFEHQIISRQVFKEFTHLHVSFVK